MESDDRSESEKIFSCDHLQTPSLANSVFYDAFLKGSNWFPLPFFCLHLQALCQSLVNAEEAQENDPWKDWRIQGLHRNQYMSKNTLV